MTNNIGRWVWKPDSWEKWNGFAANMQRCRYSVWYDFRNYQCERKPKMTIQGHGFCTQHAKMLLKRGFTEDKEGDECPNTKQPLTAAASPLAAPFRIASAA